MTARAPGRLAGAALAALLLLATPLGLTPIRAAPADPETTNAGGPIGVVASELSTALDGPAVVSLPADTSHLAVHWRGAPGSQVSIALASGAGRFGPEIAVGLDEPQPTDGAETYSGVIWAAGARFVRVSADRRLDQVTVVAMRSSLAQPRGNGVNVAVNPAIAPFSVISRAEWGADESLRYDAGGHEYWPPSFSPLQKFFVHHTAGRNGDPNPAATVRAIYYYHAITRGWGDIGYNFLIDEQGRVYEGRHSRTYGPGESPTSEDLAGNVVRGAHVGGFNDGTMGIALLGTFTSRQPTSAARLALEQLLAWEADRHGIDPVGRGTYTNPATGLQKVLDNISGHRDASSTACPGDAFYPTLPAVRTEVATLISAARAPGVDQEAPVVSSFATLAPTPTGGGSIAFGLLFDEPIASLSPDDLALGGTSTGWTITGLTGGAATYTVTVSAVAPSDGSIVLGLAAESVLDLSGNPGPGDAAEATAQFAFDSVPPDVTLFATPAKTQTSATSFAVTTTFSEPVAGFSPQDVGIGGTSAVGGGWTIDRVLGSGASYVFTVTGDSPPDGSLTISLPDGVTTDAATNHNTASNTIAFTIDRTAPLTSAPLARLRTGVAVGSASLPVRLTWAATDAGGSGITSYDLARSVDGAAFSTIKSKLTAATTDLTVSPGHTYRFRARTRDGAGNVGAWANGPTFRPSLLQQSSTSITYHGTWHTSTASAFSGGSLRYASGAGASASLTTTARSLAFVTTRGPTRGAVRIYVDGVLATTIDLYAPTAAYRQVAFARTWSSSGTHTIKVVVVGTDGRPRVDVDAFAILR